MTHDHLFFTIVAGTFCGIMFSIGALLISSVILEVIGFGDWFLGGVVREMQSTLRGIESKLSAIREDVGQIEKNER